MSFSNVNINQKWFKNYVCFVEFRLLNQERNFFCKISNGVRRVGLHM